MTTALTESTPANYYIDPKAFLLEIVDYRNACSLAVSDGKPRPRVPESLGEKLTLIARRLSFSPKFRNYSYREEMIQDGLEDCIRYFHNFDPSKGTSPFSYFTQILYYAYIGRIQSEKKQQYVRHKMFKKAMPVEGLAAFNDGEDGDHSLEIEFDQENVDDFINKYEAMLERKRNKKQPASEIIPPESPMSLLFAEETSSEDCANQ